MGRVGGFSNWPLGPQVYVTNRGWGSWWGWHGLLAPNCHLRPTADCPAVAWWDAPAGPRVAGMGVPLGWPGGMGAGFGVVAAEGRGGLSLFFSCHYPANSRRDQDNVGKLVGAA